MSGSPSFWLMTSVLLTGVAGARARPGMPSYNPRDLALAVRGATVTASSEVGRLRNRDHRATTTIDGKTSDGYWCTAFDSKPPHWLEIHLGGPKRFDEVVLYLHEIFTLRSCRVEWWNGNTWVLATEVAGTSKPAPGEFVPAWEFSDAAAGIVRCRFPAATSDRVRLTFEKDNAVRLYEVAVLEAQEKPAVVPSPPRLDGTASLIRIAFGQREEPPLPGWLPVAANTRYTPAQGIGWLEEGNRVDCYRSGGALFARAFVAGWGAPGRLRLDLPAGRYVAALFASDFALPIRPFQVEVAGRTLGRPLATVSRGAWDVRRLRMEAGPDGVILTLRGDTAWLINALLIAPERNLNALLTEADRLEEDLALGSPEWMEGRTMVPTPSVPQMPVSESERTRGYVLFTRHPVERVTPQTRPRPEERGQPLVIQATPGEAAVATLGVVPLQALFNMRLAGTDLIGSGNARIPGSALDLRVVRCWPQIDKTRAGRGKVEVVPELLETQERHPAVCAPEGATRQYWITLRVPENAPAGEYRGELRFSAEGVPSAAVPVRLTVLPLRLHTPPQKTFFFYTLFSDLSDEEIRPLLRDMRAHGMNSLAPDLAGSWVRQPDGNVTFDTEPLRRVLRLAKEAGFTHPMPWYASRPLRGIRAEIGSEAWKAAVANMLRQAQQVQQEVGGQEILFYPVDEPFGREEELVLAEQAMRIAKEIPGLRTYCTTTFDDAERLAPVLDVRCYAIGMVPKMPQAATSTQKAGATFWWYTNAARELPDVRRFLAGVWFWSTGADGQGYYVYQARWRGTHAFQDLEGDPHAHDYVAYPDVDGPIPTIQWECIRLGIDDARYLYTLEAAIAAHPGSPQAAQAQKFLDALRQSLPDSVNLPDGNQIMYTCPWKPSDFARLRTQVVEHLLKLRGLAR